MKHLRIPALIVAPILALGVGIVLLMNNSDLYGWAFVSEGITLISWSLGILGLIKDGGNL